MQRTDVNLSAAFLIDVPSSIIHHPSYIFLLPSYIIHLTSSFFHHTSYIIHLLHPPAPQQTYEEHDATER